MLNNDHENNHDMQKGQHGLFANLDTITKNEMKEIKCNLDRIVIDEKTPQYIRAIFHLNNILRDTYMTPNDEPFVDYEHKGGFETCPVYSGQFKRLVQNEFFKNEGHILSRESIEKVRDYISALAYENGEVHEVSIRTKVIKNTIYYDLANSKREIVEIKPEGWSIVRSPDYRFVRKKGMLPNVTPNPSGDINILRRYLNLPNDHEWYLAAAYISYAFYKGPFPILIFKGEQGTGKSTNSKVISSIIDPCAAPLNSKPRDERELFIYALSNLLLAFDNVSGIDSRTADTFCRISTGSGLKLRQLYTDDSEKIFYASRPILINGIDDATARGDFLSRAIQLNPPVIDSENRITEEQFWKNFEKDRSKILGGIFNALSVALRNLPEIDFNQFRDKPRMADFAKFSCALSEALGISPELFLDIYNANIKESNRNSLDLDPVAIAIVNLMDSSHSSSNEWTGTMSSLKNVLSNFFPDDPAIHKYLPNTPHALSNKVRRLAPVLSSANIGIEQLPREAGTGQRPYRIFKIEEPRSSTCDNSDICDDEIPF